IVVGGSWPEGAVLSFQPSEAGRRSAGDAAPAQAKGSSRLGCCRLEYRALATRLKQHESDQNNERWDCEPVATRPLGRDQDGRDLVAGSQAVFGGFASELDRLHCQIVA